MISLKQGYDSEIDAIYLWSGKKGFDATDLEDFPSVVIDLPESGYAPLSLDVVGISGALPLEQNKSYCAATDTFTFGTMPKKADLVVENGDLVAYWRFDGPDPDDYTAVAVDLRNASKHLAPAIAAFENGTAGDL